MSESESSPALLLESKVLDQVDALIADCEAHQRPLEIDPARQVLFELFATVYATGLTADDAEPDLSADGICRGLSQRWGLQQAAQESIASQQQLPKDHLAKMRSLWSVMRMWMEWTYAWDHWTEFHGVPEDRTEEPTTSEG